MLSLRNVGTLEPNAWHDTGRILRFVISVSILFHGVVCQGPRYVCKQTLIRSSTPHYQAYLRIFVQQMLAAGGGRELGRVVR